MKRESWLFSILFAVGLGLAWWASMPSTTKNQDLKAVVSIVPAQVGALELTAGDLQVNAKSESEDRWWIETTKAAVKDRFLGSAKMRDLLNQLNPLEAVRVIGTVKDEALAEYGLNQSTTTKKFRVIDRKGGELLSLAIGKQAYGTRNFFIQDLKDKTVMLITGEFIGDIEKAELRLYERTFTNIQFDDLQASTIAYNGKAKKLVHTRRDEKGGLIWTNDSAEGSANAAAKSWFERLDRARIVSFANDQELEVLKAAKPLFEVELQGSGSATDTLKFAKIASTSPTPDYFVQSRFLGTWAKVASARLEPVEKDLSTVVAE